jgi:type II secretory pathway pseudopilin PulG
MRVRSARIGFTLVEVLVTAAIMVLLFGMGIAAYARFDRKIKVETAAMEFATYLRKVQKRADSGENAIHCNSLFEGIKVEAILGDKYAQDYLACTNSLPANRLNLGNGAVFLDNFLVLFRSVGKGVDVPDGETTISDSFVSAKYLIEVTSGGAITVKEI